jgi:formylglycine-generating enzyme required for sulfatase activity
VTRWAPGSSASAFVALLLCAASADANERKPADCPPKAEWPEGMACVLGGSFELGDARGRRDEKRPGTVYVDSFYMDLTEVTNAAYAACIESGRCKVPKAYKKFSDPEQPVVAVSWFDAVAHCERLGKRLPTEAEWERAASGPEHTRYPWGEQARECEAAVIKTEAGEGCGSRRTAKVASRPAGHFGLFDMAGNVHEWVSDFYSPCLRGCDHECGDACFGENPRGPCGGVSPCAGHGLRSVRGGSWYWPLERARSTARRGSGAPNRGPHRFGFRCARNL